MRWANEVRTETDYSAIWRTCIKRTIGKTILPNNNPGRIIKWLVRSKTNALEYCTVERRNKLDWATRCKSIVWKYVWSIYRYRTIIETRRTVRIKIVSRPTGREAIGGKVFQQSRLQYHCAISINRSNRIRTLSTLVKIRSCYICLANRGHCKIQW